jgi:hypothetical protein
MKKVLLVGHDGEARMPFEKSKAWTAFAKILGENGFEIVEEYSEDVYAIIANSHKHSFMENEEFEKIELSRRVLILWEPYIVETERYEADTLSKYAHIFAPSRMWADRVHGVAFNWPQDPILKDDTIFENWEARLEKVVVVQGNKFSARQGELYSLRRNVLSKLNRNKLDLYGANWNLGFRFDLRQWIQAVLKSKFADLSLKSIGGIGRRYSNYNNEVNDKQKTLEKYQISLVIENSADFVSEKLFDSIRAGCLTIYVGPNLDFFELDSEVAVVTGHTKNDVLEAVNTALRMSTQDRKTLSKIHRENLQKFSAYWENEVVLANLARKIVHELL